ncbi:putative xylosidase/glycosyl hydrolase [Aspergillus clavatus NRRL 1]|uniref:Xylosidase/glycosyl hydrolase, putative n=1 Tax=Aspergillus clavatus (strain ATCC 1007 / CBS 513.65 / DSM 816 / NCTC 3887 / NRRL 1 / QM 1276 / 107) TaxID=344612 RepID=A1CLY2_ASPCL|nr:xylosidase/glycosyl hydrolase, putative [Aspergillus clavatus NRRL 1]EAW09111.1 xylosidase/glycosyl hydrolase, putative [Aspergillus clavatus NRRL 1]
MKLLLLPLLVLTAWAADFSQPVLWEDLADLDIFRVGDTYYYSASSMHYSPGAPILQSYDLVNWKYIGHSVPTLAWGDKYSLIGGQAYIKGIYASTMRYRKSNRLWYWIGCIEYSRTYVYTSPSPTGPWKQAAMINTCYYDAGLLIDDDDTMYVAYGNTKLSVAKLSQDGLREVTKKQVFASSIPLEGSRFYKRNGHYYIFVTKPANAQYVLKASNPWGPYTQKRLQENIASPVAGSGIPHQGGLVDTPSGQWYYMAFVDNYPGGRTPVLAPITWGSDGFPAIKTVNGGWGRSYPYPTTPRPLERPTGIDTFAGTSLSPQWEWNHNPDPNHYTVNNGLTLRTATVTHDLYAARNTLTHRILGPSSTGTIAMTLTNMKPGDRAGLAMLRQDSAYVGVVKNGGTLRVTMVSGLAMSNTWATISTGREVAGVNLPGGTSKIWLRASADIRPGSGRTATFHYSTDGSHFHSIGNAFTLNNSWEFYMGYRFGIFNYATSALGGSVHVSSFELTN